MQKFATAETIAARAGSTNTILTMLSRGAVVASAATSGYQIGTGVDQMMNGMAGLGAIDVAQGSSNLALLAAGLTAGKAGAIAPVVAGTDVVGTFGSAAGAVAGATIFTAGVAAAGGLTLAYDSARSAVTGEQSAVRIADNYWGTGFTDIYLWQERW